MANLGKPVGRLSVRVVPDTTRLREDLLPELKKIENQVNLNIEVLADTSSLKAQVDKAVREASRSSVQIDVDAKTTAFSLHLAELLRRRSVDVAININQASLAKATALLASLSGFATVRNMVTSLGNAFLDLGENIPRIALIATAIGAVSAALLNAVAATGSLAIALSQIAGLAALIPAAFGSLGAVVGTLITAFKGVGAAVSAASKQTGAGGGGYATSAAQAAQAALQLKQQQDALAQAHRSVRDAVWQLDTAQRAAAKAQRDLTQARQDAVQNLRDLANATTDARLAERQAAYDLQDAQAALAAGVANGYNTDQLGRLQLAVDSAAQAYKEAQERAQDAAKAQATADKKGVKGSDAVLDAQERARAAAESVRQAQQQLAQATLSVQRAQEQLRVTQLQQAASSVKAAGGTDAFAEAMAKLSPNARQAVLALLRVKDQLSQVRKVVQERFFAGFSASLLALASVVIPQLTTGLGQLGGALGGLVSGLMDSLRSDLGGGVLTQMLANTAQAVQAASPGVNAFVSALTTLGQVGSRFLPGIAQTITDISLRFQAWVDSAAKSGQLQQWIQTALGQFHLLLQVVGDLGRIVGSVFSAMGSSGAGLQGLHDALSGIAAVVSSPAFQTAMQTIFGGAAEGARALGQALGPIGDMFAEMAPVLSGVLASAGSILGKALSGIAKALAQPAFQVGLTAFFAGISAGVDAILPVLPEVAKALGVVGQFAGALAGQVGQTLAAALQVAAPFVSQLLAALQPLVPVLGQALQQAILALAPILAQLATQVLPPLVDIFIALMPAVAPLIGVLAQLLAPIIQLAGELLTAFIPVFQKIAPILVKVANLIAAILVPAFNLIIPVIMPIVQRIIDFLLPVFDDVMKVMDGLIDFLTGTFTGDWKRAWNGIVNIFSGIWNGIVDTVNGVIGMVVDLINGLIDDVNSVTSIIGIPKIPDIPKGNLLSHWNPKIPAAAKGIDIKGSVQGKLVRMGEKGIDESVVHTRPLQKVLETVAGQLDRSGGRGETNVTINEVTDPTGTATAVVRRLRLLGV